MNTETIPAELVDILRGEIGAAMDVTEDGTAMSDPNFEPVVEDVVQAVIRVLADRSTRPAEPAAPVAEVKAWLLGDPATGQWIEVDGHRVEYSRGMGTPAHVLASAFQAERARADELHWKRDFWENRGNKAFQRLAAAEQRAADALAREEKAERERDAYHDALTPGGDTKALMIGEFFEEIEVRNPDYDDESQDEDEDDEPEFITHRVPVSWTTTKAMMERLRSYAHWLAASREAQPATDGGDNG